MILQIEIEGREPRRYRVRKGHILIGASAAADIRIDLDGLPGRLCRITHSPGEGWMVAAVDRVESESPFVTQLLEPGHPLRIGPLTLRRLAESQPQAGPHCPQCNVPIEPPVVFCTNCGYHLTLKRFVSPSGSAATRLTPPPVADLPAAVPGEADVERLRPEEERSRDAAAWIDLRGAAWLMVAAVAAIGLNWAAYLPDDPVKAAIGQALALFVHTLSLAGILVIGAYVGDIDLGDAAHVLLKCACVAMMTIAVKLWVDDLVVPWMVSGATVPLRVTALGVYAVLVAVVILLPLPLIKMLFQLDRFEWMAVAAAQWLFGMLSAAALNALL